MEPRHTIDCPDCGTPIPYEAEALLEGSCFACPNCSAEISLAAESGTEWTRAKDAFAALKGMQLDAKGDAG